MHYYLVYVSEVSYQKPEPLTYSSENELPVGAVVVVPYGKKQVAGFIAAETGEPGFKTKPITKKLTEEPLPAETIALHNWITAYYPSTGGALTQLFVPSSLTVQPRKTDDHSALVNGVLPTLTKQQQEVVEQIQAASKRTFLLHGETGSGKTRVYLERAQAQLENGKSVILLVPEISLVPQLEKILMQLYGAQVVTMHSGLTKATRNRNWLKILGSKTPLLVLGTRSALFSPLRNIGLIVIDEMHEPAYKQESAPRYHALRVAAQAGKLHNAEVIYGSATPSIVEYFVASETGAPILRMTETAKPAEAVKSSVIDLKDTKLFSKHRSLSDPLLQAISQRLGRREQSLLFLNRRGTARSVLCQSCGWQALCPRCDIPLTYHGDDHTMRCHICAFRGSPPYACPECQSADIVYRSLGTKALVDSLHNLFPEAIIKRFDTDNLADEQLGKHFEAVREGQVDILVGTQMLGKGLDLPKLSLVGIINADTSLGVPDFSSSERSYQLLHQAIGRVGRGHRAGEVIVQTFNPRSPLLLSALKQNWQQLYDQEIIERKQFGFPPFYFLLKISVSRKTSQSAEKFITNLYHEARRSGLKLQINEPTPSFYEKSHGKHNWQMIIKTKQRGQLVQLITRLPKGDWTYNLDPINLL